MNAPSIAAIILAAGAGRRMGGPKARLLLDGETLLHRAARTALAAGCASVVAVVGPWDPGLEDLAVVTVVNAEAQEGVASSIRKGIEALSPEVVATLIMTVDQPAVDAALLRDLMAIFRGSDDRPAACLYAGTPGIPAVFPRRLFPQLRALEGDQGAKPILLREGAATLPFPEGAFDLDRPEDFERLRR